MSIRPSVDLIATAIPLTKTPEAPTVARLSQVIIQESLNDGVPVTSIIIGLSPAAELVDGAKYKRYKDTGGQAQVVIGNIENMEPELKELQPAAEALRTAIKEFAAAYNAIKQVV